MSEWLSPTPRAEMLERVLKRGRRIRLVRRLVVGATVAGLVAAGAAGYAAGASDTLDVLGEGTLDLPDASAAYHACPGSGPVGEVHRGDRVLLTGVSEDGRWYEVRSPFDLLDRVWVPASAVTPDASIELPEVSCGLSEDELVLATGEILETTTTTPDDTTTSTTLPENATTSTTGPESPTTVPGQVTTPTTSPPATAPTTQPPATTQPPSTVPPDTTGPVINVTSISAPKIMVAGTEFCGLPTTTTVTVAVSDPSGVSSVALRWNPDGPPPAAQKAMVPSGGGYAATTDPYDYQSGYSYLGVARMNLSIRAVDGNGNVSVVSLNANTDVRLHREQC